MNKKLVLWALFIMLLIIFLTPGVYANYQSIGTGSAVKANIDTWLKGIRNMESSGKGMGLNETINTTTALATTASNNIDVHMLKNTEYGAIILLGASDYGKQGANITARRMDKGETSGITVQASTTGNKYGIYEIGYANMNISNIGDNYYEWVAGVESDVKPARSVSKRYINKYTSGGPEYKGDATLSTKQWHGSKAGGWSSSYSNFAARRGGDGAFAYDRELHTDTNYARAGVVCGTGF